MFERFTKTARIVVRDAVHIAEGERAAEVRPEHLLLSLLRQDGTAATSILAQHAVTTASTQAALATAHRRGGLSAADTAALTELGIDVDAIVSAVEQAHGEGALEPARRRETIGPRWRVDLSQDTKDVLARTLKECLETGSRAISDEHVLLALLTTGGVAADVLTAHGVTRTAVLSALARTATA